MTAKTRTWKQIYEENRADPALQWKPVTLSLEEQARVLAKDAEARKQSKRDIIFDWGWEG